MTRSPFDVLLCNGCGTVFRSLTAEARHRHNFPLLCHRTIAGDRRLGKPIPPRHTSKAASNLGDTACTPKVDLAS